MDKVQAVIVGQNLTTGPQKVASMRTVLKGDAYTYFNQKFTTVDNEDDVAFVLGVQAVPLRRSTMTRLSTCLSFACTATELIKKVV